MEVRVNTIRHGARLLALVWLIGATGCQPGWYRRDADRAATRIMVAKQQEALGKTEPFSIEQPSDTLRRRLMIDQHLPNSGPNALGIDQMPRIPHWPEKELPLPSAPTTTQPGQYAGTLQLTLLDALEVAAANNRDYQDQKENVFQAALSLDLERHSFEMIFGSSLDTGIRRDMGANPQITDWHSGADATVSRTLRTGAAITGLIAIDVVKLLTAPRSEALGLLADVSISIPLMRGAGWYVVTEPLTQAERNVIYAFYSFEQFKQNLAVQVASEYLDVLQQADQLDNAAENYRGLIASTRRARRLAEAGRLSQIQVDQARQAELTARNRWVSAQQSYARRLDAFKLTLGLPTDARIDLDRAELIRLADAARKTALAEGATGPSTTMPDDLDAESQPADDGLVPQTATPVTTQPGTGTQPAYSTEKIVLVPPNPAEGGPYEMDPLTAVEVALKNRLDLRRSVGNVYDSQRQIPIAANALEMGLTLTGSGTTGGRRGFGGATSSDAQLRLPRGLYMAGLNVDLPLERTAERNDYRNAYIDLEQSIRSLQQLEDQIKLSVRNSLRSLIEQRETIRIQAEAVKLARRRVDSTELFLQAGRAEIRDVLDAQESLVTAQNALTSALVGYRVAELTLQRDMGVLEIDAHGLWTEYKPPEKEGRSQP